jgi:hypothetical protein
MKKTTFLKTVFTLVLCGFYSMTFAGTIFLSASGNDSNDGLSAGTAVKSFSKAHDLANAGDTVIVSGMIDFSADPVISATAPVGFTLTKNLIFQGTSTSTDGFDGKGATQLIKTGGVNLSIFNLKLTGGSSTGNGGAMVITGGTVTISNVVFDTNSAAVRGGAISIEPITTLVLNINQCVIINNTAVDAAAYYYIDASGTANTVTFNNSAIISNSTSGTGTGAGGFVNNTTGCKLQLSFINCTIAKNVSAGNSSAALNLGNGQTGTNVVFTNCTITENTCQTAGTSGAGIRVFRNFNDLGGVLKIYNTIIENNYYPTTSGGTSNSNWTSDFVWQGDGFTPGTNLIIENSIIGRALATSKWGTPLENGSTTAKGMFPNSMCQYVFIPAGGTDITKSYMAKFNAFDPVTNSYSLSDSSNFKSYGKTSWLGSGTVVDQLNFPRPTPECSIGSVEKFPTSNFPLGVQKMDKKDTFLVFRNTNNQIVISDSDINSENSISIYNALGQMVFKTRSNTPVTTIEKSFNAGLYLVSIQKGGNTITKKVILD